METKLEAPRLEMSALEKYFIHDCLLDFSRYNEIFDTEEVFFTKHRSLLSQYFHSLNRLFRKQIETKINDTQIFVSYTHNGDRMRVMFTKFYYSYISFPFR